MQFGFKSNILSFFLVCFYFSFLKLALQVFGFVSVTLVTFVMWFIISVSYLFLLFIGLFSNICKYDILSGGLQPHGSCLFQCKGTLELPWGGSFAVPPLSTAAFAVFWAASLLQNHIHPFGKIHPTLIFLPGVFSAQRFLGKNRIFLKSFGIFRKKKKPPKHGPTLFFPNSCRIQLKGWAQFWFLLWDIWIFLRLGTLWADLAVGASLGLLALCSSHLCSSLCLVS